MAKQVIKPADVHIPQGYNHAWKAGNTVFTAGQTALDKDGNLVGKGDFLAQAEQVFKNLKTVLSASGASLDDVVKVTTYLTRTEDLAGFREVRLRYFTGEPAASTLLIISALGNPNMLIEVEAIAVVD